MRWRVVLTVVAAGVACGEPAGPGRMREGRLSVAPVFASNQAAVDVMSVRIRLWRTADAPPIVDTTVTVPPNQAELELQISVPLSADNETLLLGLVLADSTGVEVYRDAGNPTAITVSPSPEPLPIPVPIEYIGPGAQAVSLQIVEASLVVRPNETLQAHAEARDVDGQVILDARVGWNAIDPLVSFDDPSVGLIRAGSTPGEARVVASLPRVRQGAPLIADTATVVVLPNNQPPVASAGPDQQLTDTDLNGSEPVTLDGSGSSDPDGTIVSYDWTEGGNSLATGVNPQVTLGVGTHTITLTVTDDGAATATDQVVITVLAGNQPPVANAGPDQQLTDTDLNGSEPVTLDGTGSSDPDGTIVGYVWTEGATQLATGVNPQVTLNVGSHTITLTVTDDGAATATDQVVITVLAGNQPPVANAGPDQQLTDTDLNGSEPVTLDGSGSSDPDGTIVSYDWTEGGNSLATGVNPQVTLGVGTHTITLTVTDDGGKTGTDQVVVTVLAGNQPPVANAGPDQQLTDTDLNGSEPVTLDGTGSSDPDGTIVSYVWTEGATQLATGVNPQITLSVGTHTITLTVTDDGGKTATDQVVVTVLAGNQPPVANAGPDQQLTDTDLNGSEPVTLDGSGSSDPDGTIVSYDWTEGGNSLATGVNPQVTLGVGTHTITLTVTDDGAATATDQVVITVLAGNQPPVANAGPDQQLTDTDLNGSEPVTLDGSGSSDPDGTIVSYVWTEGATQLATGVNPQITLSVGVHTITLTVTDDGNATATDQVVVTVLAGNQPPVANAGPDQQLTDTDLNGSEPVTLDGTGSSDPDGTIVSYMWTEGATQLATGVNPQITLSVGVHTITLTVTDDGGKTATDLVTVTVQPGLATLTVLGAGNGVGTVTGNGGIACTVTGGGTQGTCSAQFTEGATVTLSASPGTGSSFTGWSGACTGTGACNVTMSQAQTVTATFTLQQFTLTLQGSGTGTGTVTSSPAGISCTSTAGVTSGNCSTTFDYGTSVTLRAAAGSGSAFAGWSGSGINCPGTGTCTVTITAAQTVTAAFDLTQAVLSVTIDGIGSVASSGVTPAFSCSYLDAQPCSQTYPIGTQITLTATSQNPDFSFESWFGTGSGFTCTTSTTCVVTMDQDRDLRAWFSSPGLISVSPTTAAFTMPQGGTPSPSSQTITVSNIGQRPVTGVTIQTSYSPSGTAWLNATIDKTTIDTLSPATMTLSVLPNSLAPGVYNATVYVGDFVITVGQVDVTLTVQSTTPVISGVTGQLLQVNDPVSCSNQTPNGSLFEFTFSYVDGDGDVNQSTAVLTVDYQFNPSGGSGQFTQPPEPGLGVSGDGFTGTISSLICTVFGSSSSITETFTLQDSQGHYSNSLSITVPKPSNANAPPSGSSPAGGESTASTSGGAAVADPRR